MDLYDFYIHAAKLGGQSLVDIANTIVKNENFKRADLLKSVLNKPEVCLALNNLLNTNTNLLTMAKSYCVDSKMEATDKTIISTMMMMIIYKDYLKEAK